MRFVVVASFLNEERYLPTFLDSVAAQTRKPDLLLLVNDGSSDRSGKIAQQFAKKHAFARAIDRPPRPPERDRLASAAELKSFQWAVEQIDVPYDAVVKLDTDLQLTPQTFETIVGALEDDKQLGIAGAYLSAPRGPGGQMVRESNPPDHVRGPTKFYRRECYEQIQPVAPILGWDTVDDIKARMHGWETRSLAMPDGDPIHLRPVGTHDGALRGYRRWGECAWGFGAHPLHVVLGGARRMRERPLVAAGAAYVAGWALAGLRRRPRVEPEVRHFVRREELARIFRRPRPQAPEGRRRVLFLIENETFPIDERVRKEAAALVEAGWEARVVAPVDLEWTAPEEVVDDVRVFRFEHPPEGPGAVAYLREYAIALRRGRAAVRRAVDGWTPDVVVCCNPPDFWMLLALPLRRRGARLVFDHHDLSPELFEVKFGRRGLFFRVLLAAERFAFRNADVVLSSNDSYAQIARERGGVDADRVFVVRNGPDPARIYPVDPDPALRRGKQHLVVWLGRMSAQEGLEILVDAADQLVNRIGRRDTAFAIVGPGHVRDELIRDVERRGLEDYVFLPGAVQADGVRSYLATADVSVTVDRASAMNDRSTMVKTLEYMAMGSAVVMFPLAETRHVAGDTAVYAREDDAADLADKIDELLKDPERRTQLGQAARKRVLDGFSWPGQVPTLLRAMDQAARR